MEVKTFPNGPFLVNTYLVWDEETKEAMVVDPGSREVVEAIEDETERKGLTVRYILNTHEHPDHTAANSWAKLSFKDGKLVMHEKGWEYLNYWVESEIGKMVGAEYSPPPDIFLKGGEELKLGNLTFKVLYTPGHSIGSVVLFDKSKKVALVGDLIFKGSIGRYDLPMSSYEDLKRSILKVVETLEPETILLPGHGESTTVNYELHNNPYILEMIR